MFLVKGTTCSGGLPIPKKELDRITEKVLSYLDYESLKAAELVCKEWYRIIDEAMLWKKLIEIKVRTDTVWRGVAERRRWMSFLFDPNESEPMKFYKNVFVKILRDIEMLKKNWHNGKFILQRLDCHSENKSKGIYDLQYDDKKIVSGSRDGSIKVWDRNSLQCLKVFEGHTGSVLCLQYNDKIVVSGSSNGTVNIWDIETGEMVLTLLQHSDAVLCVKFDDNGTIVTSSKDRSIAVWKMISPRKITLDHVWKGHQACVNAVDFDDRYILSGSDDKTIKIWNKSTCELVRTLTGHKRGIACLQHRDHLVISGSTDKTIRLWDVEQGEWLRVLEGHQNLVRCLRFNDKYIVSGDYNGEIKVWDLVAALNIETETTNFCLCTLTQGHTSRVFQLKFDEFQIVSACHDDTILIWDFFSCN